MAEPISVTDKSPPAVPESVGEYTTVVIRPGTVVSVSVLVDGREVTTLGPWTATVKEGQVASVQIRLRVADNVDDPSREAGPTAEMVE